MFDPAKHITKLKGSDYLEVKWRLVWFRDRFPKGSIVTEAILLDWEKGVAIFKATVEDGEGAKATGTGTEMRKSFEDFVEKAETRAIGRALAALGIGTQFVGEDLSEGRHIADATVDKRPQSSRPASDEPDGWHPSADQVNSLIELAKSSGVALPAFGQDMISLMQLPWETQVTKKLLRESMTLSQYDEACQHYSRLLGRAVEEALGKDETSPTDASKTHQIAPESTKPADLIPAQAELVEDSTKDQPDHKNGYITSESAEYQELLGQLTGEPGLTASLGELLRQWDGAIKPEAFAGTKRRLESQLKRKRDVSQADAIGEGHHG